MLTFTASPDRFVVEELPAYLPSGEGSHTFLWIEKQNLTTFDAIARVGAAFGAAPRDVGYAGLKDCHARTRQWLSVPDLEPERALTLATPELTVLSAARHQNKLRLGHLHGNRFEMVLTGAADADELLALFDRFKALVATGIPNRFGAQRFGASRDNAARGLALLRGERRERDRRQRRLMLSAVQSAVFNRYLDLRAATGPLGEVRPGDVLKKTDSGGLFVSEDPTIDQPRVDARAVVPTGPLPGTREIEPPAGTPAHALESDAIAAIGATRDDFARGGRELPGARRPVLLEVTPDGDGLTEEPGSQPAARAFRLRFTLPPGAYATVVVAALTGDTE